MYIDIYTHRISPPGAEDRECSPQNTRASVWYDLLCYHECTYIHACVYIHMHVSEWCVHVCMSVCLCVCLSVCLSVCVLSSI